MAWVPLSVLLSFRHAVLRKDAPKNEAIAMTMTIATSSQIMRPPGS